MENYLLFLKVSSLNQSKPKIFKEAIDLLHAKVLELGAANEGSLGPRGKNFYSGYFQGLVGNKLHLFCYM